MEGVNSKYISNFPASHDLWPGRIPWSQFSARSWRRSKDFCTQPSLLRPQIWFLVALEGSNHDGHGPWLYSRFEYNYSDPSHPDSKSPILQSCWNFRPSRVFKHFHRAMQCNAHVWSVQIVTKCSPNKSSIFQHVLLSLGGRSHLIHIYSRYPLVI